MVDTVVIKSADHAPQEDPAHIAAMIAKVDEANTPPADPAAEVVTKPTKPEWVPEKFWDADKGEVRTEDLAKSYGELEGKLSGGKKDETPQAPNPAEKPTETPTDADAQAQLASKGLDLNEFSQEFAKNDGLSDESYEKLKAAGFDRGLVDQYIAGQRALASAFQADVKSAAGGDEGFDKMVTWAAANASPEDVAAYNKAIDSGDANAAKLAVAGMYQKYQESNPSEPNLVTGKNGTVTEDVYESVQDYLKDSRNPEYKSNPAFRQKVIAKLGRSNIL